MRENTEEENYLASLSTEPNFAEVSGFPKFGGSHEAASFSALGKGGQGTRSRDSLLKDKNQGFAGEMRVSKRFAEFVGKRGVSGVDTNSGIQPRLLDIKDTPEYQDLLSRVRNFIKAYGTGKRQYEFVGKRVYDFLGKKSSDVYGKAILSGLTGYPSSKRNYDFIGKRPYDFLGKRIPYYEFVGKRNVENLAGNAAKDGLLRNADEDAPDAPEVVEAQDDLSGLGKRYSEFLGRRKRIAESGEAAMTDSERLAILLSNRDLRKRLSQMLLTDSALAEQFPEFVGK